MELETIWLIANYKNKTVYYLHDIDKEGKAATWTKDKLRALVFHSLDELNFLKDFYLDHRKGVYVIELNTDLIADFL
jgi:hypothetical protein